MGGEGDKEHVKVRSKGNVLDFLGLALAIDQLLLKKKLDAAMDRHSY